MASIYCKYPLANECYETLHWFEGSKPALFCVIHRKAQTIDHGECARPKNCLAHVWQE